MDDFFFSLTTQKIKVPVDPTDQVMLRLKLLDALMDMSKFLFAFR